METNLSQLIIRWREFALKVSRVQAAVFFFLFYTILLMPIGLIMRILSDVLWIKKGHSSLWTKRSKQSYSFQGLIDQH